MDKSIRLPGGYRVGLDGLLGLIPGVGDFLASTVSGYIVWQAYQAGVPKSVLLRMLINVAVDLLVGAIPIVGDVFDFVFKANSRNLALLERYHTHPKDLQAKSRGLVAVVLLSVFGLLAFAVYVMVSIIGILWDRLLAG